MADEKLRSKHAFGNIANIDQAIADKKVDAYDILFLTTPTGHAIGWIDKDGNKVILENNDSKQVVVVSELPKVGEEGMIYVFGNDGYIWNGKEFVNMCKPTDLTELESEIDKKADAKEVEAKIEQVSLDANAYTDEKFEAALAEHLIKKYEITDVPVGTLIDYREDEIRIMCPKDTVFTKQSVGAGGNTNSYYMTFKTYYPSKDVVGYIEHLGDMVDPEILTKSSTDKYGRVYQTTWLALADYNEASDTWTYRGASSSKDGYYGYDYQIDWYDANGVMIASDGIRINLSNEECHSFTKPYYMTDMMNDVDAKIEERIAEIESAWEIVEF